MQETHSLNIERSILATALWEERGEKIERGFETIAGAIEARHFYAASHKAIFGAIESLHKKSLPITDDFIRKELGENYDEETMLDILATTSLSSPAPYCEELIELYKKRELLNLATDIKRLATETEKADDAIDEIKRKLEAIEASGVQNSKAKNFDEWALEDAAKPQIEKFPLGISFLNDTFRGGWEAGQLILIGGDPEAGKTMLATQVMKHICQFAPVVFFCFEFTIRKFIQVQKEVEGENYAAPNLQIIDDGYDIAQIEREIRIWAKKGAKVFVIDSQMRIENQGNKNGTVEERETEKFSRLAKLAHRLSLMIILIIQTSKSDTASGVIAPIKSKNGAHEASIILYLKRVKDKEGALSHKRRMFIAKNKQNGIHFESEINFNPVTKKFTRPYETTSKAEDGSDITVEFI